MNKKILGGGKKIICQLNMFRLRCSATSLTMFASPSLLAISSFCQQQQRFQKSFSRDNDDIATTIANNIQRNYEKTVENSRMSNDLVNDPDATSGRGVGGLMDPGTAYVARVSQ